ncbi:MAG TPA: 30S ribosomal protein S1 [Chloroflexi bacterium]|nr:30S ribosomal protein S1 [Chloroflexota bacterium]
MDNAVKNAPDGAEHPMSFFLNDDYFPELPQSGEIREGQVVAHRSFEVLIDIGAKSEGIIPGEELESLDSDTRELLTVGNSIPVYIVNPEDQNGNIILSYSKAVEEEDWLKAQELLDSQEVYKGNIIGYNRGGVLMMFGQVRGFIPASQLSNHHRTKEKSGDERLQELVGQTVTVKVIEVDRSSNRLILSEKAAMKEIKAAQRQELLGDLEEGEIRDGRIVNLADFGAFVDIGGIEGLVHLSELSWKRVNHPADLVEVGDEVQVFILSVDEERGRVALSLKRLEPDPWTKVDELYKEGELVEVTITKLTKYGAFARLDDDYSLEGLIHISELSNDHVDLPQEIIETGQVVSARIIRVDSDRRQLGLSLKQVASADYLENDLAIASDVESDN